MRRTESGDRIADESVTGDLLSQKQFERLRGYLRSRLPNRDDADDLAQEACLRILRMKHVGKVRNPGAYLRRVAHCLLYRHYTAKRLSIDDGAATDDIRSQALSLDEQLCLDSRRRLIEKAMQELPPKCQTVILLRWRDGFAVAEIAVRMGLSRGMIKKYLARSLGHFRRRLGRLEAISEKKA